MRLSDLSSLQRWLEDRWQSPLEPLRGSLGDLEGEDRRNVLIDVWDACNEGPPIWGTFRAREAERSGDGLAELFRVVLTRYQPELSREECEDIAEATANHPDGWNQYRAMMRIFRPVEPIEELEWMLKEDRDESGGPIGWPQSIMEVYELYHWTIDDVMSLTIRQFRHARSGGKPAEYGVAVAPKTKLKSVVASIKAKWTGSKKGGE
jgi:hypothetical protein